MDILGRALSDYYTKNTSAELWINTSYGEPEEMPVDIFFRTEEEMPELEILALQSCYGKILDIGAGAGSHALLLQNKNLDITALEISPLACRIMEQRGIRKVINEDIFRFKAEKFDTLLLLMNGIGLSGSIDGLKALLKHFKSILHPGGQIIFDSSDISYLYEDNIPAPEGYFGEISFQYTYEGKNGPWFNWLYIDQMQMQTLAEETGWKYELLFEDDHDQYLAKLY